MKALNMLSFGLWAQFVKFSRWVFGIDKIAVYRAKIDQATSKIEKAQRTMNPIKGQIKSLEQQLAEEEKPVKIYKGRLKTAIEKGDVQKQKEVAIELQRALATYNATKEQLDGFRLQYDGMVANMKAARTEIIAAQQDCKQKGLKLKMSRQNKAAAELAAGFSADISNPLGEIAELRSGLDDEINTNNATVDVMRDIGITTPAVQKQQQEDDWPLWTRRPSSSP
jgi:chromosome segregation ATPase